MVGLGVAVEARTERVGAALRARFNLDLFVSSKIDARIAQAFAKVGATGCVEAQVATGQDVFNGMWAAVGERL